MRRGLLMARRAKIVLPWSVFSFSMLVLISVSVSVLVLVSVGERGWPSPNGVMGNLKKVILNVLRLCSSLREECKASH